MCYFKNTMLQFCNVLLIMVFFIGIVDFFVGERMEKLGTP